MYVKDRCVTFSETSMEETGKNFLADTSDPRVQEYKKHLEAKGLMDLLTKLLAGLYESSDKPDDAEAYIRQFFSTLEGVDINVITQENKALAEKLAELNAKADELEKELEETED